MGLLGFRVERTEDFGVGDVRVCHLGCRDLRAYDLGLKSGAFRAKQRCFRHTVYIFTAWTLPRGSATVVGNPMPCLRSPLAGRFIPEGALRVEACNP